MLLATVMSVFGCDRMVLRSLGERKRVRCWPRQGCRRIWPSSPDLASRIDFPLYARYGVCMSETSQRESLATSHADIVREFIRKPRDRAVAAAALYRLVAERDEWKHKADSWRANEIDTLERLGAERARGEAAERNELRAYAKTAAAEARVVELERFYEEGTIRAATLQAAHNDERKNAWERISALESRIQSEGELLQAKCNELLDAVFRVRELEAERDEARAERDHWSESALADRTRTAEDRVKELEEENAQLQVGHWSKTSGPEWREGSDGYGNY